MPRSRWRTCSRGSASFATSISGPAEQGLTRATKSLDARMPRRQVPQPAAGPSEPAAPSRTPPKQAESKPADAGQRDDGRSPKSALAGVQAGDTEAKRGCRQGGQPNRRRQRAKEGNEQGDASKGSSQTGRGVEGEQRARPNGEPAAEAAIESPMLQSPTPPQAGVGLDSARAGRGEDEPEGDRRRASEDARQPERV